MAVKIGLDIGSTTVTAAVFEGAFGRFIFQKCYAQEVIEHPFAEVEISVDEDAEVATEASRTGSIPTD